MNINNINKIVNKAIESDLKGYTMKVLLFFISCDLDLIEKNYFKVSHSEIAAKLNGMSRSSISKAMKELKDKNIISVTRDGKLNVYRFLI